MRIQVTPRGNQILYFVYTVIWLPILIPLILVDFFICVLHDDRTVLLLFSLVERQIRKTRLGLTGID
jgi:hypothetical protein